MHDFSQKGLCEKRGVVCYHVCEPRSCVCPLLCVFGHFSIVLCSGRSLCFFSVFILFTHLFFSIVLCSDTDLATFQARNLVWKTGFDLFGPWIVIIHLALAWGPFEKGLNSF